MQTESTITCPKCGHRATAANGSSLCRALAARSALTGRCRARRFRPDAAVPSSFQRHDRDAVGCHLGLVSSLRFGTLLNG